MSSTCAWCQDIAAKRADEALAERAARAIAEVARLTEELAQTTVALHRTEQERDEARAELERLHRLAPIGQYTTSAPHEHEIARLGAALSRAEQERDAAREHGRWAKDWIASVQQEYDYQRALVARLAEAAGLADVWDPDALVQGVERLRADKP